MLAKKTVYDNLEIGTAVMPGNAVLQSVVLMWSAERMERIDVVKPCEKCKVSEWKLENFSLTFMMGAI